jgi:enoyl-CoA hydratase/carnithine racemase
VDTKAVFSPNQIFEEYSERFQDHFAMKRENGILEVRMHENGGPSLWKKEDCFGWGALLKAVGDDTENEVLILGGTGDVWSKSLKSDDHAEALGQLRTSNPQLYEKQMLENYQRVSKNIYAMLYDIDIPTIGVINGSSNGHMEMAFLCDFNLCVPDVEFRSSDFGAGMAPGDGFFAIMQQLLGVPRSNYLAYTGNPFTAEEAYDWGMVNELVPSEEIYARAWELARAVMEQPRAVRRLSHDIMRKPMRDHFNRELNFQAMAATLSLFV